MILVLSIKISW